MISVFTWMSIMNQWVLVFVYFVCLCVCLCVYVWCVCIFCVWCVCAYLVWVCMCGVCIFCVCVCILCVCSMYLHSRNLVWKQIFPQSCHIIMRLLYVALVTLGQGQARFLGPGQVRFHVPLFRLKVLFHGPHFKLNVFVFGTATAKAAGDGSASWFCNNVELWTQTQNSWHTNNLRWHRKNFWTWSKASELRARLLNLEQGFRTYRWGGGVIPLTLSGCHTHTQIQIGRASCRERV